MTDYSYATFDGYGRCLTVMRSAIPLDMADEVPKGTKPEDICKDDEGQVSLRKQITISVDREYFIADGVDSPVISGLPLDATLLINNQIGVPLRSTAPGPVLIETVSEYRSNMLSVVFLPLDDLRARYIAEADKLAGEARRQYLTTLPGQDIVYAAKEAEARVYLASGGIPGPYVIAEPGDPVEAAQRIVDRADTCRIGLAHIEGLRINAKQTIAEATDVVTMIDALKGF